MQACWASAKQGKGAFFHSPLLEELKALERMHDWEGSSSETEAAHNKHARYVASWLRGAYGCCWMSLSVLLQQHCQVLQLSYSGLVSSNQGANC